MPDDAQAAPPLEEQVQHRIDGGVSWITLNRPEVRNAMTSDQRERVISLLEQASVDHVIRAVVLTATGEGFCTGADLRGSARLPRRPGQKVRPIA